VRQGRDLLQRGEILAAKRRFEEAFRLTADAEALFMVAQCWSAWATTMKRRSAIASISNCRSP